MTALQHCKDFCYQFSEENWDAISDSASESFEEFWKMDDLENVGWLFTEYFVWGSVVPDKSEFKKVFSGDDDHGFFMVFKVWDRLVKFRNRGPKGKELPQFNYEITFTEKKTRMVEEEYWT